jgi:hypothetical protein
MLATAQGVNNNPGYFISMALNDMTRIEMKQHSNLLYKFAYCLATKAGSDE